MKRKPISCAVASTLSLLVFAAVSCPGPDPDPTDDGKRIWVPHFNAGELRGWEPASQNADLDNSPDVTLTLPAGAKPNAIAFDATGALWVTDNAGKRLFKFDNAQLDASGTPTPAVTIDSDGASLDAPIGLAFDAVGNLWVAVATRLEFYVPTDLDESGPTTPTRILTAPGFDIPAGIAFDAGGNLWLTDASFTANDNSVMVFTSAQQAAGGAQTPILTIQSAAFNLVEGITFAGGNLWVAGNDAFNVARFSAAQIALPAAAETRTLTPTASIESDADDTADGRSVRKPGGLVFTSDGDLWVNSQRGAQNSNVSAVIKFTAAQLSGLSGANTLSANVIIKRATSNPGFGGLALEP